MIFITGITGSLGSIVSKKLLAGGETVIGFSRDECKQSSFPKHSNLILYLGDIRDQARLVEASRGAKLFYHFAALKHVDMLEENPEESIATNVLGTQNVLHAQRVNKIPRVVLASTDKAAFPVNVYGASKFISERLILRNPNNTVCRYGNVLASRGSVVEKFVKSLRERNAIEFTDPNMTRFWITLDEASNFVMGSGKGLNIPVMRSAPIHLVASAIAEILNIKAYDTRMVGSRPGEKMHECLRTEYEGEEMFSHKVNKYTQSDLVKILTPIVSQIV